MLFPERLHQFTKEHADAVAALVCGLFLLCGWLALHLGFLGWALLLLPIAYVIGGYESAREGLTTLITEKELDVDLLMIVAALGAAGLGLWRREYYLIIDGAILILIFAISGALEGYAMRRTERSIRSLMSLTQDTARVVRRGNQEVIPIKQLQVGDEIIVKPGELIPTDAVIVEGYSTLNQAAITGESLPVEKTVGDEVFAGTLNGYGALKLKLHQPPESSLIQRVIRLVQQAQTETPPSQQFIERFERGYARVIVIAGVLLLILPPFLWNWDWETAIYRALTFLVVASPCALMAAIMPTLLSGIANGARQGILFKNGAQLEMIGKVRAIAFDKTGTLTTGLLEVCEVIPTSDYTKADVLKAAASVESRSEHPLGLAIVKASKNLDWKAATEVQAFPGQGIVGIIDNQEVIAGKDDFVKKYVADLPKNLIEIATNLELQGKTVVWIAEKRWGEGEVRRWGERFHPTIPLPEHQVLGIIAIADTVRSQAAETISRLKKLGIEQIVMLTGDNQQTAESVARELGVDRVYAELLPEDKLHVIRRLQQEYKTVAMVGDGINDAPALAQASVGIAMGAAGSDVALETADIVLMADRLEKIEVAIRLGKRTQEIVKQNITIALGFIILLLIGNFLGEINLPIGVVGHEGSTVLVTLSGLRLLKN
ncbi:heavy metal translocating P-type ATPase [Fischerella thermalis]|jgi:Cd2+/Zn2+-exporting ATPase|uniref:heavy metal translocating P-type ATPase n=1 Tax=Fischerella thermalis TaxID=372787 RepID=UPI000C80F41E|nr:heavy metal translocating P-type ATPase [Fischerella thermalis]PLZ10238.1 heavy metal translocating P-type ATPase [Fischerella thermalis WC119]PLZ11265.1 heavy metal translocating P-type ATPase [Fischerella thermalis WC1110]PLZ11764.1 heavy metal translocating P-type ATPase [Fischerella thermalis WC114]PLZ16982.1 heavy metal translocating P-type ATPase [Fischerella thermalis WC157]PLZ27570.1 heavy metal translocating P-type ATPase [Fischerella thermalis WC341]